MDTNQITVPEGFEIEEDQQIQAPEGFEIEEPKSISGFAKNAASNAWDTFDSMGKLGEQMILNTGPTAKALVKGFPGAIADEAKRIGVYGPEGQVNTEFPFIHPIQGAKTFLKALYDKPVSTTLDVLPAAGVAGKAMGFGKSAQGAEMAGHAARAGEAGGAVASMADDAMRMAQKAPNPLNLPDEAAQILKQSTPPPVASTAESVPLGASFTETVQNLGKRIPADVKQPIAQVTDFLSNKYAQTAKKPGWAETMGTYAEENARNMATKAAGATSGQLKKIGEEGTKALQDLMLDRGIISPKVGPIGAKNMVTSFREKAGKIIGGIRKSATERGAVHNMDNVAERIKATLDDKYLKGMYSGNKGSYMKSLAELKKLKGTPDEIADKITEFFTEARRQDPLRQPSGPMADVARELRALNEDLIKKHLTPAEASAYEAALSEYGSMKQIGEFFKVRGYKDAAGRLGPGSGIFRQAVQGFMDMIGYRGQAQIQKKFADWIRRNPEMASDPKAIFQKYIDEAVEAVDDIADLGR